MRAFLQGCCFTAVPENNDETTRSSDKKHNTKRRKSEIILKLSKDVISDEIIPCFDAKSLIAFAGVCSEWRRIVKATKVRGVKCSSVQYSTSKLMFQCLTDSQMSGLVHGDLNELFSEFSFVGNIGRKGNDNVTFKQSVFKRLFNSKKTLHSTNVITKDIPSRQVSSLTSLKLINVSVSMENLRIICNRLESLTELTLIGNDIDQRAGLILANSKLKNLTHLTIGNKIGSEGAEHLLTTNKLKCLKKLEFTDPVGTTFQTDGFIEYVPLIDCSKFPALCSFTSCRHLLSKEGIMNVLNSGISWKELTFIGCRSFDDDCILRIDKITSIEKLCLEDYCGIPYIGFSISYEYLSSLQNLTHLEISVDNNGLLELCKIEPNNLKYFCNYVHNATCELSEYAIQKFCDTFQKLTFLKFYNNKLGPGCMNHISKLPNLTDLQLERTKIDTDSIKHISRMNHLKSLILGSDISCEGMKYLCHGDLINLTTLMLPWINTSKIFDEIDATYLSASNFPKLTHLSIEYGIISNKFLAVLASGSSLKHLTHLELFYSDYNEKSLLDIMNNLCPQYLTILRNEFFDFDFEKLRERTNSTSSTKIVFYENFKPASYFISH